MAKQASYIDRLNILSSDIETIKKLIKESISNCINCWEKKFNIDKQTFHIIGPAGVGKTQACYQIANEIANELDIQFDVILIKGPVLRRDDMLCPFPDPDSSSFKMLFSDFVPKDKNSFGLFVIDEMGRADHDFQQLLWQIQNEYKLHTLDFPRGWFVVSLDNPDDQEYSMNYFEDAAGLRRSCHLYCDLSVPVFLQYASHNGFHKFVIEYISNNPKHLYDFECQKLGMVYANPASWERVSNILHSYEMNGGISENMDTIELAVSGLLNSNMARLFLSYVSDNSSYITFDDIISNYAKVRDKILSLDNSKIGQIFDSVLLNLENDKPALLPQQILNFSTFMSDIPTDIASLYFSRLNDTSKNDRKIFYYLAKLQADCFTSCQEFKDKFYEKMIELDKDKFRTTRR